MVEICDLRKVCTEKESSVKRRHTVLPAFSSDAAKKNGRTPRGAGIVKNFISISPFPMENYVIMETIYRYEKAYIRQKGRCFAA